VLLDKHTDSLTHSLEIQIVNALVGKTVRHRAIPDDNHEARILMVSKPENVEFEFTDVEYYGDGEFGIPFTASVECTLNYSIYKSDYYVMREEQAEDISVEELNDHYLDAEQDYTIDVGGVITIALPLDALTEEMSDEELDVIIHDAEMTVEVVDTEVSMPY